MYDIICKFEKNSEEYKIMDKRIQSCQLLQQSVIDSAKSGIVTMKMPQKWFNKSRCKTDIERNMCANKKPYFMMYIYKNLKKEYNSWKKQWNDECYFDFGCTLDELRNKIERTDEENDFLIDAYEDMPVTDNNSLMNRLCHIVENEFDKKKKEDEERIKNKDFKEFDYNILKCKDVVANEEVINFAKELVVDYNGKIGYQNSKKALNKDDSEKDKITNIEFYKMYINDSIYNRKEILNALIEHVYITGTGKNVLWDLFSEDIIDNLL